MQNCFKITYKCQNCGKMFSEEYEKLTSVFQCNSRVGIQKYRRYNDGSLSVIKDTYQNDEGVSFLNCPGCELNINIIITNRYSMD